jgi:hypothetical protein
MMSFQRLTDKKGVALFIVLASMATLGIFVGEITYTAQINQKLAYDRLDQVKAQALAKSGLRLALLRIRAYSELKKTISKMAGDSAAGAAVANSVVPKSMIEKIWAEPITVPFSGDISSLPGTLKDALEKFRKDSGMEGKLYISIQAQSNKFNLNSTLPSFAAIAAPEKKTDKGTTGGDTGTSTGSGTGANPTPTPVVFSAEQSRQMLGEQIKSTFQKKFEEDEKFRDEYRSFRIEDLVEEILGWSDLSYESPREQSSPLPFKKAPFYHISELSFLPSMDDQIYGLLSAQFSAGVASNINVNTIQEPVLRALLPQITKEEAKAFYEYRDGSPGQPAAAAGKNGATGEDHQFKTPDDFYKYLKDKVQYFMGSETRVTDLKNGLTQRGIQVTTEETNFLVHIEATVQQTKKTMEAMVSLIDPSKQTDTPTPGTTVKNPSTPASGSSVSKGEKSNLKVTQLRFL